jgi:two-component system, NtrC family, C4-dicarboxylate transport response regulator DctD
MPDRGPVLFVDDEASMRQAVTQWLELAGFEVVVRADAASAAGRLSTDFPGVLVTDLKMEGTDGIELLRRSQQIDPELPVILITGHGDVEIAVEAMRLGAYDFIESRSRRNASWRSCATPSRSVSLSSRTGGCAVP